MGFKPDIPPPCGQSWHISNDHQLRECPVSCKSLAGPASVPSRPICCFCVRCRLSCSCATASCWTSGSCRPISPTSWRAPWCTTLATAHKCGASSATCSCTSGKNRVLPDGKDIAGFGLNLSASLHLSFLCSLEQLGFNALLQLMIGVPLEMVHGILRISLLYMAGVLAGEDLLKCIFHSASSTEIAFGQSRCR